jgi:hypothetical protein
VFEPHHRLNDPLLFGLIHRLQFPQPPDMEAL